MIFFTFLKAQERAESMRRPEIRRPGWKRSVGRTYRVFRTTNVIKTLSCP